VTSVRRLSLASRTTGKSCHDSTLEATKYWSSYFNLSGAPTIDGTEVTLSTNQHLPVDETDIPIGHIGSYPGIEPDTPFTLGKSEPNVDHCFVVDSDAPKIPLDTRRGAMKKLISMFHPSTQLHLEIFSTEPAFQFYTGQFVDVAAAEGSPARPPRAGICVEPQRYINAINVPEWRNMVVLKQGEIWGARNVYKAWRA
jgi:aldose 1-epimerase